MQRVNLPIGTSDFERIRKSGCYYIDKTGLIGEILNTSGVQVMLITRPRRFGKTLGMNMLAPSTIPWSPTGSTARGEAISWFTTKKIPVL